jgi:hypothetical protein
VITPLVIAQAGWKDRCGKSRCIIGVVGIVIDHQHVFSHIWRCWVKALILSRNLILLITAQVWLVREAALYFDLFPGSKTSWYVRKNLARFLKPLILLIPSPSSCELTSGYQMWFLLKANSINTNHP